MSTMHAIDGDETLFDFDSLDGLGYALHPADADSTATSMAADIFDLSHIPPFSFFDFAAFSAASTPTGVTDYISSRQDDVAQYDYREQVGNERATTKGKEPSRPLTIGSKPANPSAYFDAFSFNSSPPSPGPSRPRLLSLSSPTSSYGVDLFSFSETGPGSIGTDMTSPGSSPALVATDAKGKARDTPPPSLPPLLFSPTDLVDGGETSWPVLVGTPASLSSAHDSSTSTVDIAPRLPAYTGRSRAGCTVAHSAGDGSPAGVYRRLSHARSLTSLPVHSFRRFSLPVSKAKRQLKRGKSPSNLARRLLFRTDGNEHVDTSDGYGTPLNSPSDVFEHGLYASLSAPATPYAFQTAFAFDRAPEEAMEAMEVELELEGPPESMFETRLPREIKLRILGVLVDFYVAENERMQTSLEWTARRASSKRSRWTGREAGLVELIRLGTVSNSWRDLVFDGQLWANFNFSKCPHIRESLLLKIASTSGSFVKSLDLSGQTTLTPSTLAAVVKSLFISTSSSDVLGQMTQLTSVSLSGCTALSKPALHDVLTHAPLLTKLDLQGLSIVTNETCNIIGVFCPSIVSLNLNRCQNIDAYGIIEYLKPQRGRQVALPLKRLRLAGLKYANDKLMHTIGRYAPDLEVLDLNGARSLHNTGIEAFVSCSDQMAQEEVLLTARQAGRESTNKTKFRRRLTKLRHLSLSHCPLLTDNACTHLAYAVPNLEFLELAGLGTELKDTGLVHLLRTTPLIRRLDLDEACDISDLTLEAITPPSPDDPAFTPSGAIPGSQLEVLHISYAVQVSNEALLALVRNCTRLKHIELDNTRVNGATVKEFVRLARKRQEEGAVIAVVDCRNVGENAVKDLVGSTRTRMGWRSWEARFLHFLDARDDEGLGVGTDECDPKRVALKSFFSWQTVDAVSAAREKVKRSRRGRDVDVDYFSTGRRASRWWSPGSRFSSGSASPVAGDRDRDGCIIM